MKNINELKQQIERGKKFNLGTSTKIKYNRRQELFLSMVS